MNGLPDDPSVPHANPARNMHFPGAGVGGHCLPKDTWLLMYGFQKYAHHKNTYPTSLLADARYLRTRVIIDGRDTFDPEKFISTGFIFKAVGKGNILANSKEGKHD